MKKKKKAFPKAREPEAIYAAMSFALGQVHLYWFTDPPCFSDLAISVSRPNRSNTNITELNYLFPPVKPDHTKLSMGNGPYSMFSSKPCPNGF